MSAFFTVTKEKIRIEGGLIFYGADKFIHVEAFDGPRIEVRGGYSIGAAPRWYQIGQWWHVIKLIRRYAPPR